MKANYYDGYSIVFQSNFVENDESVGSILLFYGLEVLEFLIDPLYEKISEDFSLWIYDYSPYDEDVLNY